MSEKHPAGTICVITNSLPEGRIMLGRRVVILPMEVPPLFQELAYNEGWAMPMQRVEHLDPPPQHIEGARYAWPAPWMRPIDKDADADDEETIRAYKNDQAGRLYHDIVKGVET